ncbi:MAG: hypothetical protein M3238_05145 [Actinomycetota bacterium]|nr:hypothetical protein [Actinomycetota bacterium]
MGNAEVAASSAVETAATAEGARERVWARVDWKAIGEAGRVVLVTRIAFFAVAYAGIWMFASGTQGGSTVGFLDMWTRWDARHFLRIADGGYFAYPDYPFEIAFFPLFPLLIRGLATTGVAPALAGMIISLVGSVVAGTYLYRLAEEELGAGTGRRALAYLFLFPTAVFLVAPYSESLFLAGAIAAFYYARRGRWAIVGIPAAFAVGARAAGVFLLLGLAVEFLRQKNFTFDRIVNGALALVLGSMPLLAYGLYLMRTTGSALSFMDAQRGGWYRDFTSPVQAFRATWETWNGAYTTNWMFAWRVEILAAGIGLFFLAWVLWKREWGYATYMGTTLAALMTSSWYFSIPRILLSLFPIMLVLAEWTRGDTRRHENAMMILAPLAALGVALYTHELWFF